jgi:hypothetical protein
VFTVSVSRAQPSGVPSAVHADTLVLVGALELVGSLPPPTLALLIWLPLAVDDTSTVKPNTLVPLAAIAVLLVQVTTLLAAVQLQSAEFAPLNVTAPSTMLMPLGNTSTTVIVPLEAVFPLLLTVRL